MTTSITLAQEMRAEDTDDEAVRSTLLKAFPDEGHQYTFLVRNATAKISEMPAFTRNVDDYIELDEDGEPKTTTKTTTSMRGRGRERKLTTRNPNLNRHLLDRWTNCYDQDTVTRKLVMGIAIGTSLFKNRYNSNLQDAIDALAAIFANTNLVYKAQLNVVLTIGRVHIAPLEAGQDSWDTPDSCDAHSTSISTSLSNFRSWVPSGSAAGATTHGLWHLLDDCFNQRSGTVGLAYVGTLCNTRNGVNTGVSWWTSR